MGLTVRGAITVSVSVVIALYLYEKFVGAIA